ncbi:MAG: Uma2 family endonuclease [Saprospiraceae bacterium]|nr:Uma2 family endonuclease [Saprospiraceae bacterium]
MSLISLPLEEAISAAKTGGTLERFPGTWAEFWDLLEHSDGRVEYQNGEILLDMSYEPDPHSKVVSRMIFLFETLFSDISFEIHNPNRPVYAYTCQAVFNPDVSVVQLPKETYTYRPGMTAEMTPLVLVEILSPSTRRRDFVEKLPCYQQIPSVQYLLYIELTNPMVYLYTRNAEGGWDKTFFDNLNSSFDLNGKNITLQDIYKRVTFELVSE